MSVGMYVTDKLNSLAVYTLWVSNDPGYASVLHNSFALLCSIGCLLVKLHILVKLLLYKLCYHFDGE